MVFLEVSKPQRNTPSNYPQTLIYIALRVQVCVLEHERQSSQ
jgi:hypothetical protein